MKNPLKLKKVIIISCLSVFTFSAIVLASDPGSSRDPLISLSYFDDKIEELKSTLLTALSDSLNDKYSGLEEKIEEKLEDMNNKVPTNSTNFELITLKEGETLICESGTEIIVRSGKSVIVTSKNSSGGVSDITLGTDLPNGTAITNNHLLIIPKTDGRGIKANVTGAVMIKGKYTKVES